LRWHQPNHPQKARKRQLGRGFLIYLDLTGAAWFGAGDNLMHSVVNLQGRRHAPPNHLWAADQILGRGAPQPPTRGQHRNRF
jgi:hypothetical protein